MKNNPWNTKMEIEFDKMFAEEIYNFYKIASSLKLGERRNFIKIGRPGEAVKYLKNKYDGGYGLKVLAREIGVSYTIMRTIFGYLDLEFRKGRDVVTDKTRKFRSERVKGKKSPWYDWPSKYKEMHKTCSRGIQGYYKSKNNGNVYLRSTWEYIYAKWLDKNNIKWSYEGKSFIFKNGESYRPDFTIYSNTEYIVEIKGYFKDRVYKIGIMREEYPNIEIVVIDDISDYISIGYNKEKKLWREEIYGNCEEKDKIAMKRIKNSQNRTRLSEVDSKYIKKTVVKKCGECGVDLPLDVYYKQTGEFIKYESKGNPVSGKFCTQRCGIINISREKTNRKKEDHMIMFKRFLKENDRIPLRKEFGPYCESYGIKGDIRSTFGTFNVFKEVMSIEFDKEKNKENNSQ